MGVASAIGTSLESFWERAVAGTPGISAVTEFPIHSGYSRVAGRIADFAPESVFRGGDTQYAGADRAFLLGEHCIGAALADANASEAERADCALFISSALGQMAAMERFFIAGGAPSSGLGAFSFNSLAGSLAHRFGLLGGHVLIPTGCVGGCDSISFGHQAIRSGKCERAVVGATEAPITPLVVAAFGKIGATSTRACTPTEASCPFDVRRDGFVLAEGAAMLVLESEEAALRRGATILAEIRGTGSVNNVFHMTDIHPDGEAIAASCRAALADAEIGASEIDFVSAHGSSTPQNDLAESTALVKVLGRRSGDVPVTSLKSQTGHPLSAANAIELVAAVQTMRTGVIPPTINLERQDPQCNLNVVGNRAISARVDTVLKLSSGFSGIHTAVVLGRYAA
jgi:3-oxoacyl-(acyl-carrier-protein) synthase